MSVPHGRLVPQRHGGGQGRQQLPYVPLQHGEGPQACRAVRPFLPNLVFLGLGLFPHLLHRLLPWTCRRHGRRDGGAGLPPLRHWGVPLLSPSAESGSSFTPRSPSDTMPTGRPRIARSATMPQTWLFSMTITSPLSVFRIARAVSYTATVPGSALGWEGISSRICWTIPYALGWGQRLGLWAVGQRCAWDGSGATLPLQP